MEMAVRGRTGDGAIRQLDQRGAVAACNPDGLRSRSGYSHVAAGIHADMRGRKAEQNIDGAVHRIALGDAAKTDPQRLRKAHRAAAGEGDVAPARSQAWRGGPTRHGQYPAPDDQRRDGRIEQIVERGSDFETAPQDM